MINSVILVGRITKDLVLQKTQDGKSVLNFTLAIAKKYNRDEANFINCVAWEKTAEFMERYLDKGKLMAVVGSLQSRSYDDKDGKRVYVTEVNAHQVEPIEWKEKQNQQSYDAPIYEPTEQVQQRDMFLDGIDADDHPF